MVDTRSTPPRLYSRRVVELAGPAGPALRRPRRDLAGHARTAPSGSPTTSTRRVERIWQLVPGHRADEVVAPAPSPVPSGGRPTAARRFDAGPRPLGPPAPRRSGAPASAARPSTRCSRTPTTRVGDGGASRPAASTRPPTAGRPGSRATTGSAPSSCPRASSTPSSGSACTRSPGTRRGPSGSTCRTTAGSTAPTTTAPTWNYIGDGLPSDFGFAIVVHPAEPDTIFVFPIGAGEGRYPPEAKARVWRSRDAGDTWEELGDGLPDDFYVAVMRDAMCARRPRPARALLRRPQRRRVGLDRRGRVVAADRGQPPGRARGAGSRAAV